ncbi:MAG: hypothetical protein JNM62_09740 [Flavobacteriales bacterium]|nr:hypothetical protein [Flavobacteriales bacterium]
MFTRPFLLVTCVVLFRSVGAQEIKDSTIALVAVQADYAQQLPGGDMADRFGTNSNIGIGTFRKTRNNFTLGAEGSFLFGNNVVEPGVLRNVLNSAGQVVDTEGEMADVFLYQRGWTVFATAGRIFPVFGPNENSGLHVKLGGGFMRHKIRVQTQKNVVPQLEDDYLQGYDRLAAGPAGMFYLGYQHFGNKGRINFHFGVELMVGATQALHPFNFDTEQYNEAHRLDLLTGLRAGWTLPIYRKKDTRIHYH